jgi:hypothetical protein
LAEGVARKRWRVAFADNGLIHHAAIGQPDKGQQPAILVAGLLVELYADPLSDTNETFCEVRRLLSQRLNRGYVLLGAFCVAAEFL